MTDNLDVKVREILKNRSLTVYELAYMLKTSPSSINCAITDMNDLYEEDDGKLKLVGVTYGSYEKVHSKYPKEILDYISKNMNISAYTLSMDIKRLFNKSMSYNTIRRIMAKISS